jgi:hypothetical protein
MKIPDALTPLAIGWLAGTGANFVAQVWQMHSHTALAVAVQIAIGIATGNWWAGGLAMCAWWAGREVAQAEARYIAAFVPSHQRQDMPWHAALQPRSWNLDAFLWDLCLPILACQATWQLAHILLR